MPAYPLTFQGQCITLVLAALYEMGEVRTKQETIAFVEAHAWFDLKPDDLAPHPSHKQTDKEPKWHTMIAFGRQWAIERDLMSHFDQRDRWEISSEGVTRFETVRDKLRRGEYNVRAGYLWSPAFKKWLCPDYQPSEKDAKRPAEMWDKYQ